MIYFTHPVDADRSNMRQITAQKSDNMPLKINSVDYLIMK